MEVLNVSATSLTQKLRQQAAESLGQQSHGLSPLLGNVSITTARPDDFKLPGQVVLRDQLRNLSAQELNKYVSNANEQTGTLKYDTGKGDPATVFIEQASRRVNSGLADNESAQELADLMDNISKGAVAAHQETGNILRQLGQLSAENERFLNNSESYTRIGLDEIKTSLQEQIDNEQGFAIDKPQKTLSLTVKTQEGDEIDISIAIKQQWQGDAFGRSTSVEFEVEGDLNSDEQEALDNLLNSFADVSDGFLNGSDINQLFGLEAFDAEELSGFKLKMEGGSQNLHYDYSISDNNEQNVAFDWKKGEQQVANISMSSDLGGQYDEQAVQQILAILQVAEDNAHNQDLQQSEDRERSSNDALFRNSVESFFKNASRFGEQLGLADSEKYKLTSAAKDLFDDMSQNNPNYKKLPYQDQAKLKQQYSLLADYSINIQDYDGGQDLSHEKSRQSGFNLSLSQKTEIDQVYSDQFGGYRVSQEKDLSLQSIMDNGDGYLKPGSTRSRVVELEETSNITALMSDDKLIGLDQDSTRDYYSKTNMYIGLGLSWEKEEQESSEASSKVRQLDDLWAQQIDNSKEGYTMSMEINGAVVDEDSILLKEYAEQQSTLTIIGDLDKLANDMGYRTKILGQLREIDKLMEGKEDSGSTLSTRV